LEKLRTQECIKTIQPMRDDIKLMALGVPAGTSSEHLICPFCKGGTSREKSFVVRRDASTLYYQCYRNSCDEKGAIGSVGAVWNQQEAASKPTNTPYRGETCALSDGDMRFLTTKWHFTPEEIERANILKDIASQRLVLPVRNIQEQREGCILRDTQGRRPKALAFWEGASTIGLHFPVVVGEKNRRRVASELLIVEDWASAERASAYMPTCAILGTNLSSEQACHIGNHYRKVAVALDADATVKASALVYKRCGILFDSCRVVPLPKDIKNMTPAELRTFMDGVL
jgi:hypothetical protein